MLLTGTVFSQVESFSLKGTILDEKGRSLPFVSIGIKNTLKGTMSSENGDFEIRDLRGGKHIVVVVAGGYQRVELDILIPAKAIRIQLQRTDSELEEVVVSGTLKEVSKDDSPINIDVITPKLFQKTATPNLFEATGMVNGVKPQINCNVCNTGDIHINGMEGPYTLVLIDGMPIVSGLSSVYGLMGIPAGMIERLEIAKGPAGALYGSEAMGGTINLITKNPQSAPKFYVDYYTSTYLEHNFDLSAKLKLGKKIDWLTGFNGYLYDHKVDINKDGFTDLTLQKRASWFNKFSFKRSNRKEFTIAARAVLEDRWGGQMNWEKKFWGGDSIYGESIYTKRAEIISKYEWPLREKIITQVSYNFHDQNSVYGLVPFIAKQSTSFAQTYWNKQLNSRNNFLMGLAYKNIWFDDNTAITQSTNGLHNKPENSNTLGLFLQNETSLDSSSKHKVLMGVRLDYNMVYKFIPSPRLAYKWTPNHLFTMRLNFGTGFRIVNVFTEDHAALTGAREVVFVNDIKPERSLNGSLNTVYKMKWNKSMMIIWDASVFYYHFSNKIFANYDSDPNKVIYDNLNGYAYSRGASLNASLASIGNFKFMVGTTYVNVQNVKKDVSGKQVSSWQLQSPHWSGNITGGYTIPAKQIKIDLTGNWYGPQRLPILPNDYRPEFSPWFCLLNLQVSKTFFSNCDLYVGAKNLFNYIPKDPIMRPQDPFDKHANDKINNPYGYTFDPGYNYAPIQGIRLYIGLRLTVD